MNCVKNKRGGSETMQINFFNAKKKAQFASNQTCQHFMLESCSKTTFYRCTLKYGDLENIIFKKRNRLKPTVVTAAKKKADEKSFTRLPEFQCDMLVTG